MPFLKQKDPTVPPGQTVTAGFPVLHVGDIPAIDPKTWALRVFGQVENPFELSFDALRGSSRRSGDSRASQSLANWPSLPTARITDPSEVGKTS